MESLQLVRRLCLEVNAISRNELYVPCAGLLDGGREVRVSNQACDALRIGMLLPAQFWPQHVLLLVNRMPWPLDGRAPERLLAQYPHHQHSMVCMLFFCYVGGTHCRHALSVVGALDFADSVIVLA